MEEGGGGSVPTAGVEPLHHDRFSFPFFFDPSFEDEIQPIEFIQPSAFEDDKNHRWDKASVHEFSGTYGDYVLNKVSKVFPQLSRSSNLTA